MTPIIQRVQESPLEATGMVTGQCCNGTGSAVGRRRFWVVMMVEGLVFIMNLSSVVAMEAAENNRESRKERRG